MLTGKLFLHLFYEVFFNRAFKAYYKVNVCFSMVLLQVNILSVINVVIPYGILHGKVLVLSEKSIGSKS